MFLSYNYIGESYADTITNATTYLIQAFRNLSSAVNNTKDDWSMVVSNISQALSMVSSSGGMPMSWASQGFMNVSTLMYTLFGNFQSLLQSYSMMLPMINVNQTPANIMKFVPSPILMGAVLNQIVNATNMYIGMVNSTSQAVNNTYNLFRQGDFYVMAIETQLNTTVRNMTLAVNNTKLFFNQTTLNFTRFSTTTFNNFMNSIPATLKASSQWQNSWLAANSSRDSFNMSLGSFSMNLNSFLDSYLMQSQSALTTYYQSSIATYVGQLRSNLFSYFMSNASFNTCYSRFFNQSTALFNATGGAAALFNCSDIQSGTMAEIQAIVTGYMNTLSIDVNSTLSYMQRCLNLTNVPIVTDPTGTTQYSIQSCLENVSILYF
jgi:hypothetical protein